ncbi:phosphoenolpyruvate synthase/pyruvate phosphate dikinase [Longilinea arvoryzae]|uniref:Phosphoenolpyruvate synthase/pyruvate phosphate dikinase n=1 Tax=Longilinea arvoryzae TaxID=360412 RepID=A0A0S7B872_9CHLR|nr:PEP/pyruvate-binding domain-containing protein [Longilinea arvoryzae]GAP13708.1 phosphoenolpyruvate synthase/pyruvate phosphate dikinase [Longilinea arvoryzae]
MADASVEQSLADSLVHAAITDCADQSYSGNTAQVLEMLHQGRCDVCRVFTNHLIIHLVRYLSQVDRNLKAVVKYEPEPALHNPAAASVHLPSRQSGINLIAWVDRKSAALTSLNATLETALCGARRELGCPNSQPACFNLDMQMVDDREVFEGRGYGLVVSQPFLRSMQVWKRSDLEIGPEGGLSSAGLGGAPTTLTLELTPESVLFERAFAIEKMPPGERQMLEPHLRELKVTLIRRLVSDQLAYINVAKDWLTIGDLFEVYQHRISSGKIGGKAAGLVFAGRILREVADEALRESIVIPTSYFLGSDLIYIFMAMNGLMHWNNQKYKPEEKIYSEYPLICEQFAAGHFPPEVVERLKEILAEMGPKPLIVRSSSQLEDSYGTSFAGKYESFFCPNQGTSEENLRALTTAIARTYASTLNPDALLYRRSKGLQDYDERMAVIIQEVQGQACGHYYLPFGAGVAFSHNLFRWAPQIRREDGFARLVWGLGTHAVERGGNDYPRLIALSHPTLQPDDDPQAIRYYSQKFVDVIDLQENTFKTLPVKELLDSNYPPLKYLVQIENDGYYSTPRSRVMSDELPRAAITYDELLRRTPFARNLSRALKILEEHYRTPVDVEFTVRIPDPPLPVCPVQITLLQCRPQSQLMLVLPDVVPANLKPEDIIFSTHFMVPQGYLPNVRYAIYVDPQKYFALPGDAERAELTRIISQLNHLLGAKTFICVGPGRWGTTNHDLGVFVNYADVFNAGAMIELSGTGGGSALDSSFGTHFFQDLMEAQIYPLAIQLGEERTFFNRDFFEKGPNHLPELISASPGVAEVIRLVEVASYRPDTHMEIYFDGDKNHAIAYLAPDH